VNDALCGFGPLGDMYIKDLVPGQTLQDYGEKSKWIEFNYWQRIVEKYSACNLTFIKDKLIALSGLAREV
jgi:hypothetical protein